MEAERRRAEALAEIDRGKTQFFSNISHEFRTPLTLMLGPLEEMKRESAGAVDHLPLSRQLDLVHRNGLRLLKLVNTLLDFSRIEAGRAGGLRGDRSCLAHRASCQRISLSDRQGRLEARGKLSALG